MKIAVGFSDSTLECALRRQLPSSEIAKMCGTLEQYAVSCFDINLAVYRQYLAAGNTLDTGRMRLVISAAAGEAAAGFRQIAVCVRYGVQNGLEEPASVVRAAGGREVYLLIEDAWQMQPGEWNDVFGFAQRHGIKGLIYCAEGSENVFELFERLHTLVQNAPCPVEFKASNSCRMAGAQALAALRAGVGRVHASVAGVGGDAPLEEVLMAAGQLWKAEVPSCRALAGNFAAILSSLGIHIPARKALIGPDIFAHESGIHVDGIVKNPSLYEAIRPEDVGLTRRLVIGKHSGTASIRIKLLQYGIQLPQQEAVFLLNRVRELAQKQKRSLTDGQLLELYEKYVAKGSLHYARCKNL